MLNALFFGPRFERHVAAGRSSEVIRWWESRRIFFNMVVGCTGLITCVLVVICVLISAATVGETIGLPDGPLLGVFGIFAYGILANLCYTGGWISEIILRSMSTRETSAAFGLKAFRFGLRFSMFITLLPAAICWFSLGVALISGRKFAPFGE